MTLAEPLPRLAVVVLCYNGVDLTLECLASLRRCCYPGLDLLAVDNASSDNTVAAVRAAFPEVGLIPAGGNLGYADGNNLGLRAALARGADLVFLLNNDTTVEPDCLAELARAWQARPRAGILGPMVYTWDPGGRIFSAGGVVDWRSADAGNQGAGEIDRGQFTDRPVAYINGCGLLVSRQAVEAAGLLDGRYFMYWEEVDWCLRVRAAGFEVRFVPGARMRHRASLDPQTLSATTLYYVTRNRLLFMARHAPAGRRAAALGHALAGALRGVVGHLQAGRHEHARATLWALGHALTRRWGRADTRLWHRPG